MAIDSELEGVKHHWELDLLTLSMQKNMLTCCQ